MISNNIHILKMFCIMKLTQIFKLIIEPDKNISSKAPQTAV